MVDFRNSAHFVPQKACALNDDQSQFYDGPSYFDCSLAFFTFSAERLSNFKIGVGTQFIERNIEEIQEWGVCAHVPGKLP